MNSPIAVRELVEWIILHRKGNAFKDDTYEQLMDGVQRDIAEHSLLFVLDEKGSLIGVVTFDLDPSNYILYVKNILVTKHSALVIFAQHFQENFAGFAIAANRNNEEIMYNTSRLINHLKNMKETR